MQFQKYFVILFFPSLRLRFLPSSSIALDRHKSEIVTCAEGLVPFSLVDILGVRRAVFHPDRVINRIGLCALRFTGAAYLVKRLLRGLCILHVFYRGTLCAARFPNRYGARNKREYDQNDRRRNNPFLFPISFHTVSFLLNARFRAEMLFPMRMTLFAVRSASAKTAVLLQLNIRTTPLVA